MVFTYVMSGGFKLLNCASVSHTVNVVPAFPVGSIVYIRKVARKKCKYEQVCIKEINLRDDEVLNYEDTYNRMWLEEELCSYSQATENIKICLLEKAEDALRGLKQKCPTN